jgi:hypothetical protein
MRSAVKVGGQESKIAEKSGEDFGELRRRREGAVGTPQQQAGGERSLHGNISSETLCKRQEPDFHQGGSQKAVQHL